jgi:hypothetical protein
VFAPTSPLPSASTSLPLFRDEQRTATSSSSARAPRCDPWSVWLPEQDPRRGSAYAPGAAPGPTRRRWSARSVTARADKPDNAGIRASPVPALCSARLLARRPSATAPASTTPAPSSTTTATDYPLVEKAGVPNAEPAARKVLSLPVHPPLSEGDLDASRRRSGGARPTYDRGLRASSVNINGMRSRPSGITHVPSSVSTNDGNGCHSQNWCSRRAVTRRPTSITACTISPSP